jgi:hypothetical protein
MPDTKGGLVEYEAAAEGKPHSIDTGAGHAQYRWSAKLLKGSGTHRGYGQTPEEALADLMSRSRYAKNVIEGKETD